MYVGDTNGVAAHGIVSTAIWWLGFGCFGVVAIGALIGLVYILRWIDNTPPTNKEGKQ